MLKRWLDKRAVVLILGAIAIGALIMLSAALGSLEFTKPSEALLWGLKPIETPQAPSVDFSSDTDWLERLILFSAAFFFTAFIIALFDPRVRQWLWKRMPYWIAWIVVFIALSLIKQRELPVTPAPEPPVAAASTPLSTSVVEYIPPQISMTWAYMAALAILLLVSGIAYYVWRNRPVHTLHQAVVLDELGDIVQAALNDLDAGHNWEDTIIQCYVRMSETVTVERGLQRQQAMTPSEFAERLVRAGLPASAVHRLTRLFEAVRYGAKPSTQTEVDEAVACLRTVMDACGGTL